MRLMFEEVRGNNIKSVLLISLFIVVIGALGSVLGMLYGSMLLGLVVAMLSAAVYAMIVYHTGSQAILGVSGARPVTRQEYPHFFHAVEGLAIAAGIPSPKAYVIDDTALNAFATGKNPQSASIVVTTGLLKKLDRQELEGVLAHEMSHIQNYDIRFMMLAIVLVGVVVFLSDFLLRSFLWGGRGRRRDSGSAVLIVAALALAVLTPVIGELLKLAISRRREYLADASAAVLTRYPPGLASALQKIAGDPDPLVDRANKATAQLFISTPFRKKTGVMARLFSTHPPIEDRIKRLREM